MGKNSIGKPLNRGTCTDTTEGWEKGKMFLSIGEGCRGVKIGKCGG